MRTWLVFRLLRRLGLPLLWAWWMAYLVTHNGASRAETDQPGRQRLGSETQRGVGRMGSEPLLIDPLATGGPTNKEREQ